MAEGVTVRFRAEERLRDAARPGKTQVLFLGQADALGPAVQGIQGVESFVARPIDLLAREPVGPLVDALGLRADRFDQALVLVYDLRPYGLAGWQAFLESIAPLNALVAPQLCILAIDDGNTELNFAEFLAAVRHEVFFCGSVRAGLRELERWCSGLEIWPNLVCPGPKRPSEWLAKINHHYFSNVLTWIRDEIESPRTADLQVAADFWQDCLRNVLVYAHKVRPGRIQLSATESDALLGVRFGPARVVAPSELVPILEAQGLGPDRDFVDYGDTAEIPGIQVAVSGDGAVPLVVHSSRESLAEAEAAQGVGHLCVSQTAMRLSWQGWRDAFRKNLLGAFEVREMTSEGGDSFWSQRKHFWQAMAHLSIPAAFEQVREAIDGVISDPGVMAVSPDRFEPILHCGAQIRWARRLYLGH